MEWRFWITWWIRFCIRYSRLLWIYFEKYGENTHNSSIRIYVNKIENRITFRIKTGYYLKFLTPETMKLFGSAKSKIAKNKSGVPHSDVPHKCTSVRNYWSSISTL